MDRKNVDRRNSDPGECTPPVTIKTIRIVISY
jgi:hypothetical protein